jgi:methylmalonyl-CoA mutase
MSTLSLMGDFDAATSADWMALVAKVLRGSEDEKRHVSYTVDGLAIQPLYTQNEALPNSSHALPGVAPFTRGTKAPGRHSGWDIRQIHAETDPAKANAAILDDLAGGATSIQLQIAAPGWFGLPYGEEALAGTLENVNLNVYPVSLLAGEYTYDAAGSLMALWNSHRIIEQARVGAFNADPLGTLALTGALYHPLDRSLEIAAQFAIDCLSMPSVTALKADGHYYHAAGASEAQELACVLATVVAYLRVMESMGVAPETALPKIAVNLAVDADQFLGIAKLRAARQLVWRVADGCGAGGAAARVAFSAETSFRMMAQRDPWVNILRTTMACASAAIAGADAITVLPMTWALGKPDAFARRIARNTHLVLMEESGLGRVLDPAGGSWAVEKLTSDLANKAWQNFQTIESKGGMGAALTASFIQEEIAKVAEARAKQIATTALELTGTSAFPFLGDDGVQVDPWPSELLSADLNGARIKPLCVRRLAEPFEKLRDTADAFALRTLTRPIAGGAASGETLNRPKVFIAALGDVIEHLARLTWTKNFLATGGIKAIIGEGFTNSDDVGKAFAQSHTKVACICSSDRVYAKLAQDTARILKDAGAQTVLLAGQPGTMEATLIAAGVDTFIFAGCDVVETLSRLLEVLCACD